MGNMPPNLVGVYSEIVLQLGWIVFFSMAFPSGSLFTIFAGLMRMSIELRGMSQYNKRDDAEPIVDIGIYGDLLKTIANLGIVVCIYLIIFSSKLLTKNMPYDDATMYIIAFSSLHLLFFIKYILAEVISDEPAWITEDRVKQANRVE